MITTDDRVAESLLDVGWMACKGCKGVMALVYFGEWNGLKVKDGLCVDCRTDLKFGLTDEVKAANRAVFVKVAQATSDRKKKEAQEKALKGRG